MPQTEAPEELWLTREVQDRARFLSHSLEYVFNYTTRVREAQYCLALEIARIGVVPKPAFWKQPLRRFFQEDFESRHRFERLAQNSAVGLATRVPMAYLNEVLGLYRVPAIVLTPEALKQEEELFERFLSSVLSEQTPRRPFDMMTKGLLRNRY